MTQRLCNLGVGACGIEQRQRCRASDQVRTEHLAGGSGQPVTVEDVVGNLEGEPEQAPILGERLGIGIAKAAEATAKPAGCREQTSCLERAALEVLLRRRLGTARLQHLQSLTFRQAEGSLCQQDEAVDIVGLGEHCKRSRKQKIARCTRDQIAVLRPHGWTSPAQRGVVEHVVVYERGHMHELDSTASPDQVLVGLSHGGRRKQDQQWA